MWPVLVQFRTAVSKEVEPSCLESNHETWSIWEKASTTSTLPVIMVVSYSSLKWHCHRLHIALLRTLWFKAFFGFTCIRPYRGAEFGQVFFFFFFIVTITGSRQKIESCEGIKPNPFSIAGRSTVLLCLAKKDKGAFKWWLRFLCSVSVVDWMLQYHGCDSFEVGCCLMSQAYAQIWMYSVWKTKGKGPKKEIHTNTAPWLCYSAS